MEIVPNRCRAYQRGSGQWTGLFARPPKFREARLSGGNGYSTFTDREPAQAVRINAYCQLMGCDVVA